MHRSHAAHTLALAVLLSAATLAQTPNFTGKWAVVPDPSSQGTGGVDGPLVDAIDNAKLSVDVAAYSLSLNSVRFALINAHNRGVTVRMVMESTNMDRSDPQELIKAHPHCGR